MTDLDDIERRIKDGIDDLDGPAYSGIADDAFSALAEIIAEVERLRVGHAEWLALLVEAKKEGARSTVAERATERAAVVAWLREVADAPETYIDEGIALRDASAAIESGEHRREETK